ncbi:MAG: rhomboid family intramembrane serine protease [Smithellaceae bacterium]|jgi:rhomboid protease GluP
MSTERKSMLCPNCRKLISSSEPVCPYCGLNRPGMHNTAGFIRSLFFNADPVKTIIYTNIIFYVFSLILNPGSMLSGGSGIFDLLSPSMNSLFHLGATGTMPVFLYHRPWSLISASFLHGSILHIIFNMMALAQLGPFVVREFGAYRFFIIYILAGVGGYLASLVFGVRFTIGASASICGLIGAIIYYGKSRGGYYGEAIYKQAIGWVLGLAIFGILISGINNWAHGGGILSGILIALLCGYNDKKPESAWHRHLAAACLVITAGVLIWRFAYSLIFLLLRPLLQ